MPAGVAHGQKTVQLQHQVKEALADGIAHVLAGVGVEVAHLPAAFAGGRGEVHARGVAAVGFDPEHRDFFAFDGFDAGHQVHGRQHTGRAFFHLQDLWVEGPQDLVLKRHRGTGDAHQGQHQACADAEEPMQLEQGFLQHVDRLARSNMCFTARIMP
ncbi:hypothetical protein D3C81_1761190 [compost metagenome]